MARWDYLCKNWRGRARRNKVLSLALTCLSVTLAVSTTVLASAPQVSKWIVALVSGGAALATALLAATKSQENWTLARAVQNQLHAEWFLYQQQAGRYAPESTPTDEARLRLFSERITEIQMTGHGSWAAQVASSPPAPTPGTAALPG